MKRSYFKFFILTPATSPGETPVRHTARPGIVGVECSLHLDDQHFKELDVCETTLANTVADSTRAL